MLACASLDANLQTVIPNCFAFDSLRDGLDFNTKQSWMLKVKGVEKICCMHVGGWKFEGHHVHQRLLQLPQGSNKIPTPIEEYTSGSWLVKEPATPPCLQMHINKGILVVHHGNSRYEWSTVSLVKMSGA